MQQVVQWDLIARGAIPIDNAADRAAVGPQQQVAGPEIAMCPGEWQLRTIKLSA